MSTEFIDGVVPPAANSLPTRWVRCPSMSPDVPEVPASPDTVSFGADLAARAFLDGVPLVGPVLARLVDGILEYQAAKRDEDWRQRITAVILWLHEREGRSSEELFADDVFYDAPRMATLAAFMSRREEKRQAMCNALAAVGAGVDSTQEDAVMALLDTVDRLTPSHMRVLGFVRDPRSWCARRAVPLPTIPAEHDGPYPLEGALGRAAAEPTDSGLGFSLIADLESWGPSRRLSSRSRPTYRMILRACSHPRAMSCFASLWDRSETPHRASLCVAHAQHLVRVHHSAAPMSLRSATG